MASPMLTVVRAGLLTTVQDAGRWGRQAEGVPVAGPMDPYSHRAANRLVQNDDGCAALEVTLLGPELEASADVICAVAGARFELTAGARPVPWHAPFELRAGERLRFGQRLGGARAMLAVRGGIDVPPIFGSRATSLPSRMGPLGGRPLATGDRLPIGATARSAGPRPPLPLRLFAGETRLRAMPGPHDALFQAAAFDLLFSSAYVVTARSNRMGYRLEGPALLHAGSADILSEATPLGSIQVPASGQPILLMADRQTTGGYPKIGTVISADIPLAGQLAPGDRLRFVRTTRADALDALQRLERRLDGVSG